ncbi:MAG TPA: hypothetical protein VNA28_05160 [Solirubrobacteraceae bacterium]|nr:hypothetical protein [Solirubrobacteraceae bacterium]
MTQLLAGNEPRIVLATGRYIGEGFDGPASGHARARDADRVERPDDAIRRAP